MEKRPPAFVCDFLFDLPPGQLSVVIAEMLAGAADRRLSADLAREIDVGEVEWHDEEIG
jgi:hypothetical protein